MTPRGRRGSAPPVQKRKRREATFLQIVLICLGLSFVVVGVLLLLYQG